MTTTLMGVTRTPSVATSRRAVVPWSTVVPLAVVMALGDGFWVTSLRVAVGAIERAQSPFTSWLRECALLLPLFVFAVLGALSLARRWLGPGQASRTVAARALLVALAGTLAGVAWLAASSAYDYHLQAAQLGMMGTMGGTCVGHCLTEMQQATIGLQVRSVLMGSGILLVTNLILVAWVVAFRGGRVEVGAATGRTHTSSLDVVRPLLVAGLVASAVIHVAVMPEHFSEWPAAGVFFLLLTAVELAFAALVLLRPSRAVLLGVVAASAGPLALWVFSRTLGMPFGPQAGVPEPVGIADLVACALEIGTLVAAVVLLRASGWVRQRSASVHAARLALVAVVAVTAIGLGGTNLAWFHAFGGITPMHGATHASPPG